MILNKTFRALANEATFTKDILGAGATQIRMANYAKKGKYFQAFTSLSTGLERIGKICLMLNYYIDNKGEFPDIVYFKKYICHDLLKLYSESIDISSKQSIKFDYLNNLNDKIHQSILLILSNFAKGDRYSNIDFLAKTNKNNDPIASWHEHVDMVIFKNRVSNQKKINNAIAENIASVISSSASIFYVSDSGNEMTNLQQASFQTGMAAAVAPYRQLYVLQIIRYWVELVIELQYKAMKLDKKEIPFFTEIFAMFYNPDSYFKSRKTWDKNF